MKPIILTIQSAGNDKLRLGISRKDSEEIFKSRKVTVIIKIKNLEDIFCKTSCGNPSDENGDWIKKNPTTEKPYRKKGYDLYNPVLNKWLKENESIQKSILKSKKIQFKISSFENGFYLEYEKLIV